MRRRKSEGLTPTLKHFDVEKHEGKSQVVESIKNFRLVPSMPSKGIEGAWEDTTTMSMNDSIAIIAMDKVCSLAPSSSSLSSTSSFPDRLCFQLT